MCSVPKPGTHLPASREEMSALGWDACDIILVSGDAYIDHPAFGTALIGRVLEAAGFRVGIIPQPDWRRDEDFLALGAPRLFFGISAGNIDSMVAHYTVNRKKRHQDAYSPDGKAGLRPNRASIVYTSKIKSLFKNIPVVLGGIEASLRRIAHYDYWDDRVRRSILPDSKADFLIYGMAEKSVVALARSLAENSSRENCLSIPGLCHMSSSRPEEALELPDFQAVSENKAEFSRMVAMNYRNRNPRFARTLTQKYDNRWLIVNAPQPPLSETEMDNLYNLPYSYEPHPRYASSSIPAFEQIFASITSHRGCFGNCSFCAITEHQGPQIQSRSQDSIRREAARLSTHPRFHGTITDIGGPSANMYGLQCRIGGCKTMNCLFPKVCSHLDVAAQSDYVRMLESIRSMKGINHVFVASGLRYDLLLKNDEAASAIIRKHTGGHMKIAPEHVDPDVTRIMQKPGPEIYEEFEILFRKKSEQAGKQQYLVPYFISGHPGSTMESMKKVRDFLQKRGQKLQQAADFYPTPMTLSTAMYYTGFHPLTGEKVQTARSPEEKRAQMNLLFWHKNKKGRPRGSGDDPDSFS